MKRILTWMMAGAAALSSCSLQPAMAAVYTLDLAWQELSFTNTMALGELATVELRHIGDSAATNLTMYLSNDDGDMLAITEGMTATGTYAVGELALNSTNLLAEFDGVATTGSQTFDFSVWDAGRSLLLASSPIVIRHNPLWESLAFTNLPSFETLGLSEYLARAYSYTNTAASARYALDLGWKDMTITNSMALAERAVIEIRGIGNATPSGLMLYLSDRDQNPMAMATTMVAGTSSNTAVGMLNLATTNLVGAFSGLRPHAERNFDLTVWDSERDIMLASAPVPIRNNPLAEQFVEGWTNLADEAGTELTASVAAAVSNAAAALAVSEANDIRLDVLEPIVSVATGELAAAIADITTASNALSAAAGQVQTNLTNASNALADAIAAETASRTNAGYLTAETDPLWSAWRTNSPVGTTNAILPDGSLVDIADLLDTSSGTFDHAALTNIQGGAVGQYYHLTASLLSTLTNLHSTGWVRTNHSGPVSIDGNLTLADDDLTGVDEIEADKFNGSGTNSAYFPNGIRLGSTIRTAWQDTNGLVSTQLLAITLSDYYAADESLEAAVAALSNATMPRTELGTTYVSKVYSPGSGFQTNLGWNISQSNLNIGPFYAYSNYTYGDDRTIWVWNRIAVSGSLGPLFTAYSQMKNVQTNFIEFGGYGTYITGGPFYFDSGKVKIGGTDPLLQNTESAYFTNVFSNWSATNYSAMSRTGTLVFTNSGGVVFHAQFSGEWDGSAIQFSQQGDQVQFWMNELEFTNSISSVYCFGTNDTHNQTHIQAVADGETVGFYASNGIGRALLTCTNDATPSIVYADYLVPPGATSTPVFYMTGASIYYFNDPDLVETEFETRGIDIHVDDPDTDDSATPKSYVDDTAETARLAAVDEIYTRSGVTDLREYGLYFGPRFKIVEEGENLNIYFGDNDDPVFTIVGGGDIVPRITGVEYDDDLTNVTITAYARTSGVHAVDWSTNLTDWTRIPTNEVTQDSPAAKSITLVVTNPLPFSSNTSWRVACVDAAETSAKVRSVASATSGTNDAPLATQEWVEEYVSTNGEAGTAFTLNGIGTNVWLHGRTNLDLTSDGTNIYLDVSAELSAEETDPVYSAWVTNGPGATNAILADGTQVSIDGWGAGSGTSTTNSTTPVNMGNAPENWILSPDNGAAQNWIQANVITNIPIPTVTDTNAIRYFESLLYCDTNYAITWPTNGVTWAGGSVPTQEHGKWNPLHWRVHLNTAQVVAGDPY